MSFDDRNDAGLERDAAQAMGLATQILLAYLDDDMEKVGAIINPNPHEAIESLIILTMSVLERMTGGTDQAIAQLRELAVRAEIQNL